MAEDSDGRQTDGPVVGSSMVFSGDQLPVWAALCVDDPTMAIWHTSVRRKVEVTRMTQSPTGGSVYFGALFEEEGSEADHLRLPWTEATEYYLSVDFVIGKSYFLIRNVLSELWKGDTPQEAFQSVLDLMPIVELLLQSMGGLGVYGERVEQAWASGSHFNSVSGLIDPGALDQRSTMMLRTVLGDFHRQWARLHIPEVYVEPALHYWVMREAPDSEEWSNWGGLDRIGCIAYHEVMAKARENANPHDRVPEDWALGDVFLRPALRNYLCVHFNFTQVVMVEDGTYHVRVASTRYRSPNLWALAAVCFPGLAPTVFEDHY